MNSWSFKRASIGGPRPVLPIGTYGTRVARLEPGGNRAILSQPLALRESSDFGLQFDWAIDAPAGAAGVLQVRVFGLDSKTFELWTITSVCGRDEIRAMDAADSCPTGLLKILGAGPPLSYPAWQNGRRMKTQNGKCTKSWNAPTRTEEPLWQTILGCLLLAGLWALALIVL